MSENNPGTGIGNKWTAKLEREDYERIIKNYRPRGTHTLGNMFRNNPKKTSSD
jgi:hypothetical protein